LLDPSAGCYYNVNGGDYAR